MTPMTGWKRQINFSTLSADSQSYKYDKYGDGLPNHLDSSTGFVS